MAIIITLIRRRGDARASIKSTAIFIIIYNIGGRGGGGGVRKLIFSFIFRGGAVAVPSPRRGHRRRRWRQQRRRRRGSSSIGRDDEHAHRPATTPTNPALRRRSRLGGHRGGEEKARASPPPPPAPSPVRRPSLSYGRAYRSVGGDPSLSCLPSARLLRAARPATVGPAARSPPPRRQCAGAARALSRPTSAADSRTHTPDDDDAPLTRASRQTALSFHSPLRCRTSRRVRLARACNSFLFLQRNIAVVRFIIIIIFFYVLIIA